MNEGGVYTLAGYIPVHEGHWGGYWHLQSMPMVYVINITPERYELSMRTSWWTGETAIVDKDMKTMTQEDSWVE